MTYDDVEREWALRRIRRAFPNETITGLDSACWEVDYGQPDWSDLTPGEDPRFGCGIVGETGDGRLVRTDVRIADADAFRAILVELVDIGRLGSPDEWRNR